MAQTTVSGLVSGLDAQTIIQQMMQVERQPQIDIQTRQQQVQAVMKAYQQIAGLVQTVQDTAGSLADPTGWQAFTASSSSTAVTATTSSGATDGSVTFTVDKLATAASMVAANSAPSMSSIVATGPLTITVGGTAHAVGVGDGSLASVITAINGAGLGVRAAAVQVASGQYKLQLTATTTGAASSFAVDPTNLDPSVGGLVTLDAGQDAQITETGGLVVTSSTNSVSGLLPGLTVQLSKADPTTPVTVTVSRDGNGLADKVQKLVDAVNAALNGIQSVSSYNPDSKQAGPLLGDLTIQQLQQKLTQAVSDAVAGNALGSAGLAGLSVTKDGTLSFDRSAFLAAYAKDPSSVSGLFERGGTATDSRVSFLSAGDQAQAGTYGVTVTQAAQQASVTGATFATLTADETISVRVGSTTVSYAAHAGDTVASVAAGLNQAVAGAGLGLAATVVGGAVKIQSSDYGSGATFDVMTTATGPGQTGLDSAAGVWETHTGVDVAGTLDVNGTTVNMTGIGQVLTAPVSDPTVPGLSLRITATPADISGATSLGTFTYSPGVAQRLVTVAVNNVDPSTGRLTEAVQSEQSESKEMDDEIAGWDVRLALKQTELQRQFASLETALSGFKSQGQWLAGQIAGLG